MHEIIPNQPTPRPLTVAHAIHSGGFYGAEKVLCDLAREQAAGSECAPRLLALLDPDQDGNEVCERADSLGVPVARVRARRGITWAGLQAYARALRETGAGLVHSHGYKATAFHMLSRWSGMHRVPLLVTAHGYPKASGSRKAACYRWLDLAMLGAADGVVAVSAEMARYLREHNPLLRPSTIPNGVADSQPTAAAGHPLRAALGVGSGIPIIGTAGRMVPMKNHTLLIRAYARVRKTFPCRLAILGDGPLRPMLEELWRSLIPDEPVGLFPFQPQVLAWMADMDVFSLPSEDGEGLPIALLEAGLLERAVVCSDVGGIPEVVRDWVTGRVFPRGDENALVRALEDLLPDPERRAACGRALRNEVLERHDIRAVHTRYLEAYAHALAAA